MTANAREMKVAGLLLLSGVVLFFITIFFEFQSGWVGWTDRPPEETPAFIHDHWPVLKSIWSWQKLAHVLWTVAFILLIKSSRVIKGIPLSALWACILVGELMMIAGFDVSLGGYEATLPYFEEQPELFLSIRGAVAGLYRPGDPLVMLVWLLIFNLETFTSKGLVPRKLGIAILGIMLVCIVISSLSQTPRQIFGLAFFLFHIGLGLAYWRFSENDAGSSTEVKK